MSEELENEQVCAICDTTIVWEYGVWVHVESHSSLCPGPQGKVLAFARPMKEGTNE